jgi:hypothetical protein
VRAGEGASRVLVVSNFLAKGGAGDVLLPEGGGEAAGNVVV